MLQFKLGPFPVTVELSFLLTCVLLGGLGAGIAELLAWVFVVFVSVLVHELGHALVGRAFGGRPEIVLQGLGGVTFPRVPRILGAGERILLSLAGPVAGLLLGVAALALLVPRQPVLRQLVSEEPGRLVLALLRGAHLRDLTPLDDLLFTFVRTSVVWAALNLLPVLPLDGGHVLEAGIAGVRKKPAIFLASVISAVLAGSVAAWGLLRGDWFLGILFGVLAFSNVTRARAARGHVPVQPARPDGDPEGEADAAAGLEEARQAVAAGDQEGALAVAQRLEEGAGAVRPAAGLRIRAGVLLAQGQHEAAALDAGRSYSLAASVDAAAVAARAALRAGDEGRARSWVQRAIEAGASAEAVRADPELGSLVA